MVAQAKDDLTRTEAQLGERLPRPGPGRRHPAIGPGGRRGRARRAGADHARAGSGQNERGRPPSAGSGRGAEPGPGGVASRARDHDGRLKEMRMGIEDGALRSESAAAALERTQRAWPSSVTKSTSDSLSWTSGRSRLRGRATSACTPSNSSSRRRRAGWPRRWSRRGSNSGPSSTTAGRGRIGDPRAGGRRRRAGAGAGGARRSDREAAIGDRRAPDHPVQRVRPGRDRATEGRPSPSRLRWRPNFRRSIPNRFYGLNPKPDGGRERSRR